MARSSPRGAVISLDGVEIREAASSLDALSAILSEAATRGWYKYAAPSLRNFAMNLRTIRKRQGLTQKELGDRLGITYACITQWECGARQPKLSSLHRLAGALGVSVEDLLKPEER